jgi:hypothetical protein
VGGTGFGFSTTTGGGFTSGAGFISTFFGGGALGRADDFARGGGAAFAGFAIFAGRVARFTGLGVGARTGFADFGARTFAAGFLLSFDFALLAAINRMPDVWSKPEKNA